jgi:hypothetical protein
MEKVFQQVENLLADRTQSQLHYHKIKAIETITRITKSTEKVLASIETISTVQSKM